MVVDAAEPVRRMRGGAQAWLIRASSGDYFVVKFLQNGQHPRILINEWLASHVLLRLQLCAAVPALIRCTDTWLSQAAETGLGIQLGGQSIRIRQGLHYGSQVPVDPMRVAMFDYLPDSLMDGLENRRHFHGMLAFDQWVSNADTRQAVYFRSRPRDFLKDLTYHPAKEGLLAMMIDHGYAFQGPEWVLDDLPRQGLYPRPAAYAEVQGWDDFEPWLTQIVHFPESAIDDALKQIPSAWFHPGEDRDLERLLEQLLRRRKRVPSLIAACRKARPELFPNWKTMHAVSGAG